MTTILHRPTTERPKPWPLGSALDLTDMLDTCECCTGTEFIPAPGGGDTCHVCHGVGLARLCGDCHGLNTAQTCDGCDGHGQVA
ncbi:hypothetical protein L6E12_26090 [Actinokineospora sp. PR83]|uniref:hypothetical protein n=1 Tax=Actinokineospora sp. PR83 TaxID=2884908 RepID=UPI001F2229D5|nr:hypothetical protein [Actinokineospora sp. PR83]MCG8919250.1 hypothetical protein [Actinokineospora sp. PR83]